jgi:carbon-monoxide dehydrogenase small subunit
VHFGLRYVKRKVAFNVSSFERSPAARLLANFAHTPFVAWDTQFASFEGFWQGLKFPQDSPERRQTFALWGEDAKRAGQRAGAVEEISWNGRTIRIGSPEHHELARLALRAKILQNPAVRRALLGMGSETITHALRRPDGVILPDSETLPAAVFTRILTDLRHELRGENEAMTLPVTLTVNGIQCEAQVEPRRLLSDFLREDLGLKGVRVACEHGICGACTVLVGGRSVRSCLMLAVQADGERLLTVEGLAPEGELHPLQQAFWDEHGLQCGFCTPGMLMAACELLQRNPRPTESEVRHGMTGNVCRCTGYVNIVKAILAAAEAMDVR